MSYVSREQIEKAREMDLLTYLRHYEPEELVHISGGNYCTKSHDSLKISNGKWHWFSRGIGGRTALDYLIKVKGYSLPEAVEYLLNDRVNVKHYEPETKKQQTFTLPEKSENNSQIIHYLTSRGIHRVIINYCLEQGLIYESIPYHNVVFVGRDSKGEVRYAALRGTVSSFKGDATGSDKHYGFCLGNDSNSTAVHVFESAIDLLSYTTLKLLIGDDWKQERCISVAGITTSKTKVPLALKQYLLENKQIINIHLHLDNDDVGREASRNIIQALSGEYQVRDEPPKTGKDVNEQLQIHQLCSLLH